MKALLITKDGFRKWFNMKDDVPYITIPQYTDVDFADAIMSVDPSVTEIKTQRKDFYRERTFLNEDEELVGVYKER